MLARTAENLFWLACYMERADYVARLIGVAQRMASMAGHGGTLTHQAWASLEWTGALTAAGVLPGYHEKYDEVTPRNALSYLIGDRDNSSSILACFEIARRNARSVRAAITSDMWDAINSSWLELANMSHAPQLRGDDLTRFLEWTKSRAGLFNGAYANTMLRATGFYFTRLGNFLERADNTARLLDVRHNQLMMVPEATSAVAEFYEWTAILRAASGLRAYHLLYAGGIAPKNVADMLVCRPEMPRSLHFAYRTILGAIEALDTGGPPSTAQRLAATTFTQIRYASIDEIFSAGLHEYLTQIIEATDNLGAEVSRSYLGAP